MSKKKPTLKSEIARGEGFFTQNILDLSRRIDRLTTEALETDRDLNNLRIRLAKLEAAKEGQAALNVSFRDTIHKLEDVSKTRGLGPTLDDCKVKFFVNPSTEAQATIKRQAEEIESWKKIATARFEKNEEDFKALQEMEATWKRVAEERLREIEQLRADDTDLREELEKHRSEIVKWQRLAESKQAQTEALRKELTSLQADLKAARARYFSPFRPGCE